MSNLLLTSVYVFSALALLACGASTPPSDPSGAASSKAESASSASPGIDSPALHYALPSEHTSAGSSSSAPPDGVIRRIVCKESEADATCSERASREALASVAQGARVLGVTIGADASSYRAALEIDGVVQMMDASTTDEVAAQAKELQNQGHRVTVKSVEAVSGTKRERRALVVLKLSGG